MTLALGFTHDDECHLCLRNYCTYIHDDPHIKSLFIMEIFCPHFLTTSLQHHVTHVISFCTIVPPPSIFFNIIHHTIVLILLCFPSLHIAFFPFYFPLYSLFFLFFIPFHYHLFSLFFLFNFITFISSLQCVIDITITHHLHHRLHQHSRMHHCLDHH